MYSTLYILLILVEGESMYKKCISLLIDNKEWLFSGAVFIVLGWIGRLIIKRRSTSHTQSIQSGDKSTNVQAGGNITIRTKKIRNNEEE